jgi:hypothetical protein
MGAVPWLWLSVLTWSLSPLPMEDKLPKTPPRNGCLLQDHLEDLEPDRSDPTRPIPALNAQQNDPS